MLLFSSKSTLVALCAAPNYVGILQTIRSKPLIVISIKMIHALPRYEVVDREFLRLKPSAKSKSKTPLIKAPIPSGLALKLLGVGLR